MSRLLLVCDGCGVPVAGSEHAVLHVVIADALQHEREATRWGTRYGDPVEMAVLLTFPELAHWAIHCDTCNPHRSPDGALCDGCYWISLNRCQTEADLLRWTAHLTEKTWLASTDWTELIRRVVGDLPL